MAFLGWWQVCNAFEGAGSRFTAQGVNAFAEIVVVMPWDLNFQIKSCAILVGTK